MVDTALPHVPFLGEVCACVAFWFEGLYQYCCLGAADAFELSQDGGYVNFYGVFRQAQFVGDLLVEQAVREAQEHAELLRGELREAGSEQRVGFGAL